MREYAELEKRLRALLNSENSSIHLTFNDHKSNYVTVAEEIAHGDWHGDWISEEEKQKAIETDRAWTLQWYPDTPVGFYACSASTLEALLTHCLSQEILYTQEPTE